MHFHVVSQQSVLRAIVFYVVGCNTILIVVAVDRFVVVVVVRKSHRSLTIGDAVRAFVVGKSRSVLNSCAEVKNKKPTVPIGRCACSRRPVFETRARCVFRSMKTVDTSMGLHNHKGSAVRKQAVTQIRLIISLLFVFDRFNYIFAFANVNMSINPVVVSASVKQTATVSTNGFRHNSAMPLRVNHKIVCNIIFATKHPHLGSLLIVKSSVYPFKTIDSPFHVSGKVVLI